MVERVQLDSGLITAGIGQSRRSLMFEQTAQPRGIALSRHRDFSGFSMRLRPAQHVPLTIPGHRHRNLSEASRVPTSGLISMSTAGQETIMTNQSHVVKMCCCCVGMFHGRRNVAPAVSHDTTQRHPTACSLVAPDAVEGCIFRMKIRTATSSTSTTWEGRMGRRGQSAEPWEMVRERRP